MKLLVILLVPLTCFCQQQPGQSFVYSNSGFTWSTLYISKVDSFATCSTFKTNTVVVTDSVRGGTFVKYSGNMAVDNGMIFSDATGGKWLRQVSSDYLDIRWFGAKSDGSDTRDAFIAAINSAKANMASVKIKFPQTEDNSYYYFSDSVAIDSYVEIFGDGHKSKLKFAQHKKGFVFTYPNTHYSILRDIYITSTSSSESPSNTWDSSKHGIIVKSPVYFSNIWVNGFDGCGIYIVNDLNGANPGNASTSVFNLCHSYYNLLHGIYIQGGDVNAMTFTNCDIVGNGGVGIYDKSFLGNHYSYNHIASNGSPELTTQRGLVKKDGVVYACIKDTTKNITPPNAAYWQVVNNSWIAYNSVQTYDATKTYYAVGSIILEGRNQYGTIMGNYVESDQAPGYIDQNNLNINSSFLTRDTASTTLYANLGKITTKSPFIGEKGISSSWLYAGDMGSYIDGYSTYPTYSGIIVGSNNKSGVVKFYDNFTNIGQIYTTSNSLNTYLETGKKYVVTADTINIVGTLQNNGSPVSGGGVSQSTLNDSTAALRTTIATKQDVLGNNSVTNSMLAGSIATSKISNYTGYSINVQALTSSPADGATVYFGTLPKAPVTAAGNSKIYIRKACTLKIAEIYCFSGTAGTNESWSLYVRVNNTTDNLIATVSSNASQRIFSNTGLNISLNAGDYIEIKGVQPTWATNPLTTIYGGYLYFE